MRGLRLKLGTTFGSCESDWMFWRVALPVRLRVGSSSARPWSPFSRPAESELRAAKYTASYFCASRYTCSRSSAEAEPASAVSTIVARTFPFIPFSPWLVARHRRIDGGRPGVHAAGQIMHVREAVLFQEQRHLHA